MAALVAGCGAWSNEYGEGCGADTTGGGVKSDAVRVEFILPVDVGDRPHHAPTRAELAWPRWGPEMSVSRGDGSVERLTGEERAYHHTLLGTEKSSV
jgi:hypothetical protein